MSESSRAGKPDSPTDSGDKSVVCPTCGDDHFSARQYMKAHHKRVHGESIDGVERECHTCDKTFRRPPSEVEGKDRVYCSQKCQHKQLRTVTGKDHPNYNRVKVNCSNCGKSMDRIPAKVQAYEFLYCSSECMYSHEGRNEAIAKHHRTSVEVDCAWCGLALQRIPSRIERAENHFCDIECKAKHHEVHRVKDWAYNYKPNSDGYYGVNWPQQRKKARSRDGYRCQSCGINQEKLDQKLHVHHITPRRKFDDMDRANRLENLVSLCGSCHRKWEGIPLKPQLTN